MLYTTRINIYTHNINARNKHACDNIKSEYYYERIKSIVFVSMFDSYSKVTKKRLKFISTTENNKKILKKKGYKW